jgi:hypothetical protein
VTSSVFALGKRLSLEFLGSNRAERCGKSVN